MDAKTLLEADFFTTKTEPALQGDTGVGEHFTPVQTDASCVFASSSLIQREVGLQSQQQAFPRFSSTYLLGEAEQGNPVGLGS